MKISNATTTTLALFFSLWSLLIAPSSGACVSDCVDFFQDFDFLNCADVCDNILNLHPSDGADPDECLVGCNKFWGRNQFNGGAFCKHYICGNEGVEGAGTCKPDDCGGISDDFCWCDELCVGFGDCCVNACGVCQLDACDGDRFLRGEV